MAANDDDFDEDDFSEESGEDGAFGDEDGGSDGDGENGHSLGISRKSVREWLTARRGWVLIVGLAIAQAVFGVIMIYLRSEARPVAEIHTAAIRDLAVDMLGYEVKINQIYQLVPMRGGKRMTVGLDIVLVLGQLPEERVEGAPRPNDEEFALFVATINSMEPSIRSMVNTLLQKIPPEDYGSVEVYKVIKNDVRNYVNNTLDRLDFGKGLRPGIGKRRVTDVFLPMFVRQYM